MSDTKAFRKALKASGFNGDSTIFNDRRKATPTRRLKLWFGDSIFNAPQHKQRLLEQKLKEAFGKRYLAGYFSKSERWYQCRKSLCIVLEQ